MSSEIKNLASGGSQQVQVAGTPAFTVSASGADLNLLNNTAPTIANPATTVSAIAVMMGIGAAGGSGTKLGITPQASGRILIFGTLVMSNATALDGGQIQLAYGTGTAPANGAAASGTVIGKVNSFTSATAAAAGTVPFFVIIPAGTLTTGTAYWLDFQYAVVTGGTLTVSNVVPYAIEL